MSIKDFTLWLGARMLWTLACTFSLVLATIVVRGRHDAQMTAPLLWIALISVVCYGGGVACYVTRKTTDQGPRCSPSSNTRPRSAT